MEINSAGDLEYIQGGEEFFERLFPLRKELLSYHAHLNHDFQEDFHLKLDTLNLDSWKDTSYSNAQFVIASKNNRDYGYVFGVIEPKRGFVHSLYLRPEVRRLGIGRELMKRILKWFELQQVCHIELDVCAGNEEAVSFYRQFGFSPRKILMIRKT